MGPSRAGGGMLHSSSSSGIFFQGDMQSQGVGNAQLGSFGNMTNPNQNQNQNQNQNPGNMHPNMVSVSADINNNNIMNRVATSGPSIGASSMVTDANSGLSGGGPHLQRSASINTESYMRLPASPLSFTSNNPSISGSTIIDGPSAMNQNSNHDPNSQLGPPRIPNGSRVPGSFGQDHDNISHLQKKPRLDVKQEADIMQQQQQVVQQILQRQDPMQMQNPNPQLQAMIQQQRLRQQQQQQQQLLQSLPPVQRAHLLQQQQQQLQLRQQLQQQQQQQGLQPPSAAVKRPYDGGVCSRRLMQYLYHQRQRPADNSIAYWRKFVAEYYSPRAKKRWCLSLYDNVGHHSLGVFPQAAVDAWQCDICGSKSGRGFEATFEVMPRLNEIKFSSGVIDELLYFDLPRESRFPSGVMMLEYNKAVQETVYEQLRVVRQGQLKVIFTPDLKILSWEFCARRHEELLPRRLVAPQVNQLLQVAQKCQSTIAEGGPEGVSQQDLQTNSNMVVAAGRQLAKSLELQSLNDLGFSKRYVRCLQISEVVSSMKDLMEFCQETKAGPIEGLKGFPRKTPKLEMEQVSSDRSVLNKAVALHPGINSNSHQMGGGAGGGAGAQSAVTLSNYQNMLMRQKSMNSNPSPSPSHQQESPSSSSMNQNNWAMQMQNSNRLINGGGGGFQNNAHLLLHHQQQQQQQQQLGSQGAQQQHMIHQILQDMNNNNNGGGGPKPSVSGQSGGSMGMRYGSMTPVAGASPRPQPTRSNSFKGAPSPTNSTATGGGGGGNIGGISSGQKPGGGGSSSNMMAEDFMENGFFNNDDLDEAIAAHSWKE